MTSDMAQVNDIISRILLSLKSPTFTNEMSRNQNILLIVGANIHIYTLRGLCLILTTSYKLGCFFLNLGLLILWKLEIKQCCSHLS